MTNLIIKLYGGTGNQLFQFFTALIISRINNCKLFYDDTSLGNHDSWGRHLSIKPIIDYYDIKFFENNKNLKLNTVHENSLLHPKYFLVKSINNLENNNIILEGLFQNYRFFFSMQKEIRNAFENIFSSNTKFNKDNFKDSVSVHLREFHNFKKNNSRVKSGILKYNDNLSKSYYVNTLSKINEIKIHKKIYLYSDTKKDTNLKSTIKDFAINQKILLEDTNEMVMNDLELIYNMSLSENLIISNSTFSWWSAFLSKSNIYCPVYSLWDKNLRALDHWHQIMDEENLTPYTIFGGCDYSLDFDLEKKTESTKKIYENLSFFKYLRKFLNKFFPNFIRIVNLKKTTLNYFKKKNIL